MRSLVQGLARGGLVALVLLLPVKFGTVVNVGEIAFFPTSALEWILAAWPPFLMPMCAGAILLLALAAGDGRGIPSRRPAIAGIWLVLLVGTLPGLLRTTEWDHAALFLWHLLGIFCLAAAAERMLRETPGLSRWLLAAVTVGTAFAALSAWQQVAGGGYAQTLAYAEQAARENGTLVPEQLRMRLTQGRAAGPFVYPNSLAAHLVLTVPIALWCLWRSASGEVSGWPCSSSPDCDAGACLSPGWPSSPWWAPWWR